MRSVVLILPPNFEHVMARLLLLAPLPQRGGMQATLTRCREDGQATAPTRAAFLAKYECARLHFLDNEQV
jgi:hypothetical protein